MPDRTVGSVIEDLRTAQGLSQGQFAGRVGLNQSYISQLERGLKNPTLRALRQIAEAFGLQASDLVIRAEKRRVGR